jgi:hypothetical protein
MKLMDNFPLHLTFLMYYSMVVLTMKKWFHILLREISILTQNGLLICKLNISQPCARIHKITKQVHSGRVSRKNKSEHFWTGRKKLILSTYQCMS